MTTNASNLTAQQARDVYVKDKIARLSKASQGLVRKALDPLTIPEALDNGPGYDENLIPVTAMQKPLEIHLEKAWAAGFPARLKVFFKHFDGTGKELHNTLYTVAPTFPIKVELDTLDFQADGQYSVVYNVNKDGASADSEETLFTINTSDPCRGNKGEAPVFEVSQVTEQYLTDKKGLPITFPLLINQKAGDTYDVYIKGSNNHTAILVYTTAPRPVGFDPLKPMEAVIPLEAFSNSEGDPLFADGPMEILYLVKSRAGFEAQPSHPTVLQLILLPAPANMQPAYVPLAVENPDPLIDRADANLGVTVQIIEYENWTPDDNISIYMGNQRIDHFNVGDEPTFPLESKQISFALLTGSPVDLGPKNVDFTWKIERHGTEFPMVTPTTVAIDLRIPGPENPGEGPENPNLGKVTVMGGGDSPEANKIRVADIGKPVTVTLPTFNNMTTGDTLELIYNKIPTNVKHEIVGDEDKFTFVMDYKFVTDSGDGLIPVQVSLTAGDPSIPGDNVPITVAQDVEVNTFVVGKLTPPAIPFADEDEDFHAVGCDHKIWEGAAIKVAGDTLNFSANDTVTVHWEGHLAHDDDQVIPESKGKVDHTLTAPEVSTGFEIKIPFVDFLKNVADVASAPMRVWIQLTKTSGATGESAMSWFRPSYTNIDGCKCISESACATPPFKTKASSK